MPIFQDLVHVAREAATRAADYIRTASHPSNPERWDQKGLNDFVTDIDRTAEQIIAETLGHATPEIPMVGEELTPTWTMDGLAWVVDPLDGTTNYLHRFPAYAVSIAAVDDGTPVAAVVVDVPAGRTYHAGRDSGAWVGDDPLRVAATAHPSAALIGTGFPFKHLDELPRYLNQFTRVLRNTSGVRRAGAAALDLAMVAAGGLDGFWELSLAPWDVAAGTLLVREAGGLVTDLDGKTDVIRHGSIVAGNPPLHAWLLRTLNEPT